jgi:hypothetical protein
MAPSMDGTQHAAIDGYLIITSQRSTSAPPLRRWVPQYYWYVGPHDAFSDPNQPVTVEGDDPDDVLKALLGDEVGHEDTDAIEPALDE